MFVVVEGSHFESRELRFVTGTVSCYMRVCGVSAL